MADVTELLIAAMERHITWHTKQYRGVIHDDGSDASDDVVTQYVLTLDSDVGGGVLYMPEDLESYVGSSNKRPMLNMGYNGTVRRGNYCIDWVDIGDYHGWDVEQLSLYHDGPVPFATYFDGVCLGPNFSPEQYTDVSVTAPVEVLLDENGTKCQLCLLDVLALAAAQDARKAGRSEDEKALLSIIPVPKDMQLEPPYVSVFDHITEPRPLLVRGGGKQFTAAMGADTRTKGRTKRNTEQGVQYTRAGADNGLIITASESGQTLVADAGTNKLLCHIGNVIVRDSVKLDGNTATVHTSVGDILAERGLEPTRSNKERVKAQIRAVMLSAWGWEDDKGTQYMATVSGGKLAMRRGGDVEMVLSKDFMQLVMNHGAGIVPIDPVLLTTDDRRYQSAFAIGYRLASHTFMNADKPNAHRLGVSSILSYAKAIPTAEEIETSDRGHQTSRIIGPFERSLDYLVELGYLRFWDYCHANGEPLTDAEQDARLDADGNETPLPYDIARDCLITWEPVHAYVGALQAATDARGRNRARALEEKAAKKAAREAAERRIARKTEAEIAKRRARSAQ